jgi:hypothetical protein
MAEPRQTHGSLQLRVDYEFDRLHDSKLAQAYSLLVPVRERPVGGSVKEFEHEDSGDLRTVSSEQQRGSDEGQATSHQRRAAATNA